MRQPNKRQSPATWDGAIGDSRPPRGYFHASKEGSQMANQLQGRKVAILAADVVEKVELERPRAAVEGVSGQVQLLSLKTGEIQAREHDLEPASR
jgi:hypothetical protein